MELKDYAPKPKELKGHFCIEVVNKNTGKVIDSYEDNNLIVNKARFSMSKLLANHPDTVVRPTSGITGFKIGTRGHNTLTDNILEPKIEDKMDTMKVEKNAFLKKLLMLFTIQYLGIRKTYKMKREVLLLGKMILLHLSPKVRKKLRLVQK